MNCPRCDDAPLFERNLGDWRVEVCTQCQGVWFDSDEARRLGLMHLVERSASAVQKRPVWRRRAAAANRADGWRHVTTAE
mgnify:CR=1 FL=1